MSIFILCFVPLLLHVHAKLSNLLRRYDGTKEPWGTHMMQQDGGPERHVISFPICRLWAEVFHVTTSSSGTVKWTQVIMKRLFYFFSHPVMYFLTAIASQIAVLYVKKLLISDFAQFRKNRKKSKDSKYSENFESFERFRKLRKIKQKAWKFFCIVKLTKFREKMERKQRRGKL